MYSRNEKGGRGRGKRLRGSSREDQSAQAGLAALNHHLDPESKIPPSETSFDQPSPSSRTGTIRTWPSSENTTLAAEPQSGPPVNVITSNPPPGKVAIPALRPRQIFEPSGRGSKKGRISHACETCRRAKAGCSGEQPCSRCKNTGTVCVYGEGKREHDRKMVTKLRSERTSFKQHNNDVTDALRRIQLDHSLSQVELRAAIDEVIAMTPASVSPAHDSRDDSFEPSRRPSSRREEREVSDDETDDDIGSTGSLDLINVDTDRDDTRGTGHLGKASAVSWAKRTSEECRKNSVQGPPGGGQETGHALTSYHVEDADVEYVETSNVNLYDWPEYNFADALVRDYFVHTHPAFPLLDRASFMEKYKSFPRGASNLGSLDLIWLGILNLVFAISAVFGDLTNHDDQGRVDDHLVYCARAKALVMDQNFLFKDPRLSTTTFLGLMSLYYISTCNLNKAWTVCGLAFRNAMTLGLHVRSEVDEISDVEKEHRVRLWWSLYSLEVLLNELTGRPSCICDRDISTPLPVNIDEKDLLLDRPLYQRHDSGQTDHSGSYRKHSSKGSVGRPFATYEMPVGYSQQLALSFPVVSLPVTSSTYFIYRTQLSIISHEILTQLYCAAAVKQKWPDVQDTMKTIDQRLLSWRDSLPEELNITFETWTEPNWNDANTLLRLGLAISWNSARMILFRPSLCRTEGRLNNQTQACRNFEQEAVDHCIHSARRMIALLKWSAKSEARFYAISPWWNTLHYLCQALSVLMLEMAFEAQHLPNEKADILTDAKQGILWLVMLSSGSIAARKAWEIFDNLIRLVAPRIRWSVFDLPMTAPVPAHYNWRRFRNDKSNESQPWHQLSQERLQEHQASQPLAPDPMTAWTNQGFNQHFPEIAEPEQFGNQLNSSAAIERFTNLGQIYGHFDDPWPQLFVPTTVETPIDRPGFLATSQAYGSTSQDMNGEERYLAQSSFDSDVGGYETLSPTTVNVNLQGFQQGNVFEEQSEQERRHGGFGGSRGHEWF